MGVSMGGRLSTDVSGEERGDPRGTFFFSEFAMHVIIACPLILLIFHYFTIHGMLVCTEAHLLLYMTGNTYLLVRQNI